MKHTIHTLIILLCLHSTAFQAATPPKAESSPDSLLNLPIPKRIQIITNLHQKTLRADTSKAKSLVEDLTKFFEKKGSKLDQLVMKVCLLNYQKEDPKIRAIFLDQAATLLKEAKDLDNALLVAVIHQQMAMYYYNTLHEYPSAFHHYFQMFEYIKDKDESQYPDRTYATYLLARAYYDFFDYENAIRIGITIMDIQEGKVLNRHIYTTCLLGMAYLNLGKLSEALYYFRWGLEHMLEPPFKKEAWIGILKGNTGIAYYGMQEYQKAIPYLQEGLNLCTQAKIWDNTPRFSEKLARIYLARKQPTKALSYAELAMEHARAIQDSILPIGLHLSDPYKIMSDCQHASGNYRLAYLYADSAATAQEQWKQQMDVAYKHHAEIAREAELFKLREQQLREEKERQIYYRNGLLVLVVLTLLIGILLYNRQVLIAKNRRQQLLIEKRKTELELESAEEQLRQIKLSYQKKNRLIEQLTAEVKAASTTKASDASQEDILVELRNSVLLTDDDWLHFTQLFEKVHRGFLNRMRERFPDLTPAELRFLVLYRLGYSSQEMSAMLGVGSGAIRQYRLRVRRKLEIPVDADLDKLVAVI